MTQIERIKMDFHYLLIHFNPLNLRHQRSNL